jgi:hypothetical protein
MSDPKISILHRLPGRLRLRVIPMPENTNRFEKELRKHPGIDFFQATPRTSSVLIRFDRYEIVEAEVVIRLALSLSVAKDLNPVRIERSDETGALDPMAAASGLLLFGIGVLRYMPSLRQRTALLDMIAAAGTGASILAHTVEELKEDGTFHPETLSVIYMMVSLAHGRGFSGSLLSWLTSFGRHFKGRFVNELIMHAEPQQSRFGRRKRYSISLKSGNRRLYRNFVLRFIPALIAHAITGGSPGSNGMIVEVEEVSENHGYMLEGLAGMKDGISIHIRN